MSSETFSRTFPLAKTELGCEELQAVQEVLASGWLSMGPATEAFELAFADYLGVRHAVAVASGTAALHLAHLAAGLGPGDEVICPSFSFVATANSIVYTGARPVFADISGCHDVNISAVDVMRRLSSKTRALTVMHYSGHPCNMAALRRVAKENGLLLIEDAAHAIGSVADGTPCGAFGDLGCFSFFANKNMTSGEGGMVVTDNKEMSEILRQLRSHGMTSMTWDRHRGVRHDYDVVRLGYNYRIDEMRAALGLVQLRKLPELNRRRRLLTEYYRRRLKQFEELTIPFDNCDNGAGQSSCHLMPIVLGKGCSREPFRKRLLGEGIQTSVHYPAIHTTSYYRQQDPSCSLPNTEDVASRIVTLPLFPSLELEQIDWIVDRVKETLVSSRQSNA